jgi:manganese/iron transport system ATP-binding protein
MIDIDPKMPLSVFDAVLAGTYGRLGLFRKPGNRERDLARSALRTVGLVDLAHRPLGHLSGGERQRTALARALAQEPDLLLLDEPTASLDWQAQREILTLIRELIRQYPLTVLMATHDLNAVSHIATHAAMLKRGRLIWQGTTDAAMRPALLSELYDVPIALAEVGGRRVALF